MKIPIEFEQDFDTMKIRPIALGRLYLGQHIAQLLLSSTGRLKLAIDRSAIEDGSIVFFDPLTYKIPEEPKP